MKIIGNFESPLNVYFIIMAVMSMSITYWFLTKKENKLSFCYIFLGIIISAILYWIIKI